MSDFTSFLNVNYNNSGSTNDASATWTGSALGFGHSDGSNELRWASSGSGATGSTSSASWPYMTRPTSGTAVVPQCWAFATDTSGVQVMTYDGTNAHYNQFRVQWDALGTYASQPMFSFFSDSTLATPSPGTQPGAQSGSPMINGSAADTSSTSYMKMNAYGRGTAASGSVQDTPSTSASGTTLSVTSGTAGAVSPPVTPGWLTTWQSAQGFVQYIQNAVTPQATFAGNWYFLLALYTGVTEQTGTMLPTFVYQYSYS